MIIIYPRRKSKQKAMREKEKENENEKQNHQNGARTLFFFSCQVSVPYCGLSPMDPFPATLDSLRYCSAQGRTTGARDQCRDFSVVAGKEGLCLVFLLLSSFSYFQSLLFLAWSTMAFFYLLRTTIVQQLFPFVFLSCGL